MVEAAIWWVLAAESVDYGLVTQMGPATGSGTDRPGHMAMWAEAGLLGDGSMPGLDGLARSAARVAAAPVAGLSIVDVDQRVLLRISGSPKGCEPGKESSLADALCRRVVDAGTPLIAADVRAHPLLRGDPAVGPATAMAYAGLPVRRPDGQILGVLWVMDTQARLWSEQQLAAVQDIAAAATSQITLCLANAELTAQVDRLRRVLDNTNDAFVSLDDRGLITAWNDAARRLFGWDADEAIGRSASELIVPPQWRAAHERGLARVRDTGTSRLAGQRLELTAVDRGGREFPIELTLQAGRGHRQEGFHAFLHDISDRTATLRALEHERTFLQALLDSLDTGVAACDSDGRLVLLNPAVRAVLGPDAERAAPEDWAATLHLYAGDGRTALRPEQVPLTRAFNGEQVDDEQIMIRVPGTPARRFLVNGRPINSSDGSRLGAVIAMHDITQRHNGEVLRRARHAVARVLADADSAEQAATATVAAIADPFGWICGEYWQPDGQVLRRIGAWSAEGSDVSAFINDHYRIMRHGEGLPGLVWDSGQAQWTRDLPRDTRSFVRRQAAEQVGLHAALGLPIRSGDRLLGVLTFFTDTIEEPDPQLLTVLHDVCSQIGQHIERRRGDELAHELAAARRDLDRIVDRVNDFLWTLEVLPNAGMRVVFASRNSTGVFGGDFPTDVDPAETMRRHVHPDDRQILDTFLKTLASGRSAELECRLVGSDNTTRWLWARGVTRQESDRLFIDGISTNITERRQLAEERERLMAEQQQHLQRLQEHDRMKDELVALVSHELRNPIATIRGYIDMMHDEPELSGECRTFTDLVDRHSAHLQHLVDDLLDLARLDAGHVNVDARPSSLSLLVEQSINDHRRAADAKHLTITVDLPPSLSAHGDPVRLRQALDNLLSNAVKYSNPHNQVHIAAHQDGDHVILTISDNGIGVPPEQYPRLFERFFRASTATTRGIKGTGLGLAITKAIIEAHGGTIMAAPHQPRGTTFTVCLPTRP
ncbi:ATP-binding protein [Actinoplanes xinjiangensis]|uniref:ATP-binding protein n=1 Tax=Actinoplanes xinjiangensis TaxID=512350 RepID=UPI003446F2D6